MFCVCLIVHLFAHFLQFFCCVCVCMCVRVLVLRSCVGSHTCVCVDICVGWSLWVCLLVCVVGVGLVGVLCLRFLVLVCNSSVFLCVSVVCLFGCVSSCLWFSAFLCESVFGELVFSFRVCLFVRTVSCICACLCVLAVVGGSCLFVCVLLCSLCVRALCV